MRPPAAAALSALALLALLGAAAPAADLGAALAPYLEANERGAAGVVVGRAFQESKRGGGEPTPWAGVSVLLLPRSASLETELAGIKSRWRDSPDQFVDAEPKIRAARLAYERAVLDAGGAALIKGEMSDAAGTFRVSGVPEGQWMVLAWREVAKQTVRSTGLSKGRAAPYVNTPEVVGRSQIAYWLTSVDVKAGKESDVHLSDRNVWITAVREDRQIRTPASPTGPGTQQGANPR